MKAVLPQMPCPPAAPVEALSVARVTLAQGAGKRIGSLGNRHQMDVIRHQAIAEQRDAAAPRAFAQSFKIEAPVIVEQEDILAVVAPLCDVMRHARRHHPGHPSHLIRGEHQYFRTIRGR